ncbi:hypothetical protein NDU88_005417 [Pleurodeles waltl]|uniref:Uncharacterized protein n=1 Tax=Pleurodeles waltl TaxID=8319 RepID=A0AAV7W7R8_PLEWA|nr:hypothetical protein NDU88_005417 [Pleurodeles waltl]
MVADALSRFKLAYFTTLWLQADKMMTEFIKESWKRTKHAYETAWQVHKATFDSPDSHEWFTSDGVLQFLALQRGRGKSLPLIRRQISVIGFFAGLRDIGDPPKDSGVQWAIKGWEHLAAISQDNRRPIDVARLFVPCVCLSQYKAQLFNLAYSFAFFRAFRISQLVVASKDGHGTGIDVVYIKLLGSSLQARIKKSETDPLGREMWVAPLCSSGYRFVLCGPNARLPLLPAQKHAFQSTGTCGLHLTHTFPIYNSIQTLHGPAGGRDTAAALGVTPEAIQRGGRQRLACFERYVRPHLA